MMGSAPPKAKLNTYKGFSKFMKEKTAELFSILTFKKIDSRLFSLLALSPKLKIELFHLMY